MIYRFFGGKGGVGKTTCAAACAVARAEAGARVLVASTDPAHSLGDALEIRLARTPQKVAPRLSAVELDADAALDGWLDERKPLLRTIALRGTYLDDDDVDRFFELSLPGVDELVGLHELLRLSRAGRYDEVIVDTAPTGHTLRLLGMPETLARIARVLSDMQGKHRLLAQSLGGVVRADACDEVIDEIAAEADELARLVRDPARAQLTWVLLPERLAVEETRDALAALAGEGIPVAELFVNRMTPPPDRPCALCEGRRRAEAEALRALERGLRVRQLPALPDEPRGIAALRRIGKDLTGRAGGREVLAARAAVARRSARRTGTAAVRDETASFPGLALEAPPGLRLLVFGGKGGVGKTTCAAATALVLAERHRRRRILLLSTDPAHSLGDALAMPIGDAGRRVAPNLFARELDAAAELRHRRDEYREAVDELFDTLRGGSRFDATVDRQIAQDLIDFAPPGLDELFAVLAVMAGLDQHDLVIVDTAPTGHALRLLALPDAALEWVHALLEILLKYQGALGLGRLAQELLSISRGLRGLHELLRDRERTRFVAVTRPAALPRAETVRLLSALDELGIAVSAVLCNAVTPAGCRRCTAAAARETAEIDALARASGTRAILLASAVAPPPRGPEALRRFGRSFSLR